MGRYDHLERALGKDLFSEVQKSKILVVGAGGIGCELLKNLVLSGFRHIEVIDLDTIDVSNLNRQFLFRSRHVGLPKSTVAREAAMSFNPDADLKAFHGNIKAEEFGINYFKAFDLVLNALDNVNARQHVNRLCLAADIPLIDSGTTGYLGQTSVIKKGETKCYDCEPKTENRKSYPICTIRNTPEKPVHCIVWAKELFKLMFGRMDESMLSGSEEESSTEAAVSSTSEEEKEKAAELQEKEKEVRSLIMTAVQRPQGDQADDVEWLRAYAKRVFDAVFDNEIQLKLKLRDGYKGAKKKPAPLSFDQALQQGAGDAGQTVSIRDQRVLSLRECAELFVESVLKMWSAERRSAIGDAVFDKDDEVALDFVTAASNLRSHVFSIERKSKFDVKGIAGNIIHAIATTNAIVAGIQVLEAIKILSKVKSTPLASAALRSMEDSTSTSGPVTEHCRAVWVVREPIGSGFLLQPSMLGAPNTQCVSCGNAILTLCIDTSKATLGMLVAKILKGSLGVHSPMVMCDSNELFSEGEGLDEDEVEFFQANLPKTLQDCPAGGIRDGTILDIEDFVQNLSFKLVVSNKPNEEFEEEGNSDLFTISGEAPQVKAEKQEPSSEESGAMTKKKIAKSKVESDDEIILVDDEQTQTGKKRARQVVDEQESTSSSKRSKSEEEEEEEVDDNVVVVLDDE